MVIRVILGRFIVKSIIYGLLYLFFVIFFFIDVFVFYQLGIVLELILKF